MGIEMANANRGSMPEEWFLTGIVDVVTKFCEILQHLECLLKPNTIDSRNELGITLAR